MLTVRHIINTPVPSNCYVIYDKTVGKDCVIVDPGSKSDKDLIIFFEQERLNPKHIILTHEHFDHCWGVNELVEKYHTSVICSQLCSEAIKHEKKNCSVFYNNKESFVITSNTISVESLKQVLPFAGLELHFYYTPGHTDASICFTVENYLFTGDTLIKNLRTVTKLPTGSITKLKESLDQIQLLKGNNYIVFSGHGEIFHLDDYDINGALY
jgi:glyoxylase-like metal-dependent hydrolase (beta-lactamase superfamily II)